MGKRIMNGKLFTDECEGLSKKGELQSKTDRKNEETDLLEIG